MDSEVENLTLKESMLFKNDVWYLELIKHQGESHSYWATPNDANSSL
jgi:hypothetical protein